jgi:hypothetical protein
MSENLKSFLYGLLVALMIAITQKVITNLVLWLRDKNKYDINGFYISKYNSAFDSEISANDLVYVRCLKNKLVITYQQYHSKMSGCKIFKGEGYIATTSRIAISYQYSDKKNFQNGVMLLSPIDLTATEKAFSGKFYEYDTRKVKSNGQKVYGSDLRIYGVDYILIPIYLKLIQRLKFYINRNVYHSHEDIGGVFDNEFR